MRAISHHQAPVALSTASRNTSARLTNRCGMVQAPSPLPSQTGTTFQNRPGRFQNSSSAVAVVQSDWLRTFRDLRTHPRDLAMHIKTYHAVARYAALPCTPPYASFLSPGCDFDSSSGDGLRYALLLASARHLDVVMLYQRDPLAVARGTALDAGRWALGAGA